MRQTSRLGWQFLSLYIGVLFAISLVLSYVFLRLSSGQTLLAAADTEYASKSAGIPKGEAVPAATPAAPPRVQTPTQTNSIDSTRHTINAPGSTCSGQVFRKPKPLNTATLPFGVTVRHEPVQMYTVAGATLNQLRAAVQSCPVREQSAGQYHALTAYTMTWQYTPVQNIDGTCELKNIKVANHLSQYFPQAATDSATWGQYTTALYIHEDGHIQINARYTNSLYAKLVGLQNIDCASLRVVADEIVRSEMTILATAHELYDAQTDHGASQGAIL